MVRLNGRMTDLAEMCQGIAINHPNSKFCEDKSFYLNDGGFSSYEFKGKNIEIYTTLLTTAVNSFDVVFNGMPVLRGYGPDENDDVDDSVEVEIYIPGLWELLCEDIYYNGTRVLN